MVVAQSCVYTLAGQVVDEHDRQPMEDVSIYITELGKEYWTDSKGRFEIPTLCVGFYHLAIQHIGCPTVFEALALEGDTTIEFTLEHHENLLHEVEVHDDHEHALNEENIGMMILDQSAQKSLATSLANLNGVSMISNGSDIGLPVLHGLSGNRITIINNGVVHAGQQWGADHSPEIDLNSAGEITVVSGAASMRYPGTHMGGIVVLMPGNIPLDPHIHGKVRSTLESNGLGGTINGQLYQGHPHLRWRLGTTLKHYGDRSAPNYLLNNTGTRQAHMNGELRRQWVSGWEWETQYAFFNAEYGILRGSHIGNLTDLQSAFSRPVPFYTDSVFSRGIDAPKQDVTHHQFKSTLGKELAENTLEWNVAVQRNKRQEFDVRRSGRSDIPALSLIQYSVQNEFLWSNNRHWDAGYQFLGKNNWNLPETGILPLLPNFTSFTNGLFINAKNEFEHISTEFGGRYDFTFRNVAMLTSTLPRTVVYYGNRYHNISALARVSGRISTQWTAMAEVAFRQRPPEINEMYAFGLHQGVSGIEEGNLVLYQESGVKSTVQLSGQFGQHLHLDFRTYAHYFNGYIYLQPQQEYRLTIRGAFPVFTYEQCDARILGVDMSMRYEVGEHWKFNGNWSFLQGNDLTNTIPLNYMPPFNALHVLTYELGEWYQWRNFRVEATHRFVGEQGNWAASLDFVPPPEAYRLFDLHIGGTLNQWRYKPQIRLGVENLLNTKYRDYLNRQRYFADALGRNITVAWIQNF